VSLFHHKIKISGRISPRELENLWHSPSIGVFASVILVLAPTLTIGLTPARAQSSAKAATQEFVNQALQILRDKQKSVVEKRRELKPLI